MEAIGQMMVDAHLLFYFSTRRYVSCHLSLNATAFYLLIAFEMKVSFISCDDVIFMHLKSLNYTDTVAMYTYTGKGSENISNV